MPILLCYRCVYEENEKAASPSPCMDDTEAPAHVGETPSCTLATVRKGKGKKGSRMSVVRSEAAKKRWAKARANPHNKVKLNGNIFEAPEQ